MMLLRPMASRAVIGLGGDSKPRSQLGHSDTCGREEQQILLPSLLQPLSPAARQFLLAGSDSHMGWWWWCCAMQCRRRRNVLASAVDEESCPSGTNSHAASPFGSYLRAIGMPGCLYAKH